jgi:hypothetical protein
MFQGYLQNRAVAHFTGRHGQLTKGGSVKRFALILAATGVMGAALATSASANPPTPPAGCAVVVTTPAATTGSAQGLTNKVATFDRLCNPVG